MSIIVGMGTFISDVYVNRIFEPIVPATSATFDPILATIFCHIVNVQHFPG
jgi:hypothetical protein